MKLGRPMAAAVMAASLMLPVSVWQYAGTTVAYAEGANDPAPEIIPAHPNGEKVLFDNTHGETAGAADWVIDGAFSDFGSALANDGYYVKELRKTTPITLADLQGYDVFVLPESNIPFKASEQQALADYVKEGGSIFFIADHYNSDRNKNRWDAGEIFNGYRRGAWDDPTKGMSSEEANSAAMQGVTSSDWLAQNFGVRFRYNAIGDVNATNIVSPDQTFGITQGVHTVAMHAGSTLAILDPTKAKGIVYLPNLTAGDAWPNAVDQGVYDGGGIAEGPMVAIAKDGEGKAAFIGDSSPVEDSTPKYLREDNGQTKQTFDGFSKEGDDGTLLVHIVEWLANHENYTSFDQVGLQLDQPTQLHDWEIPQNSTEPQPEPWAAPDPGYKWWDPSTFKPGSYGGPDIVYNATYGFVHQATLPNAVPFQVRVTVDHAKPNTAVSGINVGVYLSGGTQVAEVQNPDGTWPTSYGYSQPVTLITDANGHASKDFTMQLKPGSVGSANLRVRQTVNGKSTNLRTESVTIANVPAEPLPPDGPVLPALTTIGDARQQPDNTPVTVEGVITTPPGIFGSQGFYLQDATGGVYVYQSQSGFHVGDKVKVTAPITTYNGERELSNLVALTPEGTASVPAPKDVTQLSDDVQGQLVQLRDVNIENIKAYSGAFEFDAVGDGQSVHVRVDARTGLTLSDFLFPEGSRADALVGVASIFNDTYELKVRGAADIQDTTAPVTTLSTTGQQLSNGSILGTAQLTLSASDDGTGVATTEYQLDGGAWQAYTDAITVDGDGPHTIAYRSIDRAGNTESAQVQTFDVVAPTLDNLHGYIEGTTITPHGQKVSLLAHLQNAMNKFDANADEQNGQTDKAQQERQVGLSMLQTVQRDIEQLDTKNIDASAKADLLAIVNQVIAKLSVDSETNAVIY